MSIETTTRGPFRAIGVRRIAKNQNEGMEQLWREFVPNCGAISMPPDSAAFGICRCIPGVKDGSYEYIAAFQATDAGPVPEGMTEVQIPRGEYLVHRFHSDDGYLKGGQAAVAALNADPSWKGFCNGPDDCQCAAHPCFEYYPPEFRGSGPVYIYLPVQRA